MCCGAPVPLPPSAPSGSLRYAAPDPALVPARSFLDQPSLTVGLAPTTQQAAFPWGAVAAGAALLTGVIALLRYADDRKTR